MGVLIECCIIEHYPDMFEEAFGFLYFSKIPEFGEEIMLKWLDGKDAYKTRVIRVDGLKIHTQVEKAKPLPLQCTNTPENQIVYTAALNILPLQNKENNYAFNPTRS